MNTPAERLDAEIKIKEFARVFGINEAISGGVLRYVMHRIPTGDFLRAVLANDLMDAAGRADAVNGPRLMLIARFVYNAVPGRARGSTDAVDAWVSGRTPAGDE